MSVIDLPFVSDEFIATLNHYHNENSYWDAQPYTTSLLDFDAAFMVIIKTDGDMRVAPTIPSEMMDEDDFTTKELAFALTRTSSALHSEMKALYKSWQPLFFWKRLVPQVRAMVPEGEAFAWCLLLTDLKVVDVRLLELALPYGFDHVAALYANGCTTDRAMTAALQNDLDITLVASMHD